MSPEDEVAIVKAMLVRENEDLRSEVKTLQKTVQRLIKGAEDAEKTLQVAKSRTSMAMPIKREKKDCTLQPLSKGKMSPEDKIAKVKAVLAHEKEGLKSEVEILQKTVKDLMKRAAKAKKTLEVEAESLKAMKTKSGELSKQFKLLRTLLSKSASLKGRPTIASPIDKKNERKSGRPRQHHFWDDVNNVPTCPVCQKGYTRAGNVKLHFEKKHPQEYRERDEKSKQK